MMGEFIKLAAGAWLYWLATTPAGHAAAKKGLSTVMNLSAQAESAILGAVKTKKDTGHERRDEGSA